MAQRRTCGFADGRHQLTDEAPSFTGGRKIFRGHKTKTPANRRGQT
ncbi:hypothetical protein [Niastella populi]|nr:hypothetical protein [Niastella populi]